MDRVSESALLDRARRFDAEALATIFDCYAHALYKYALHYCHDVIEADNIVGDVFSQLLEHLSAGKGPRSNLRSYLYQIAYHIMIDQARYSQHLASLEPGTELRDSKGSVPNQVEDKEVMDALQTALENDLTNDQRHVIVLRFREGFDLQETARITGKSVNAVKVLQNRAVNRLQQILDRKLSVSE